jgi:hypothetical protein
MQDDPGQHATSPQAALEALSLPELEEVAGELHRRIGVALRRIGEMRADAPLDPSEVASPRMRVARLAAACELAALTLAALLTNIELDTPRLDRQPALAAALMYGAPTLGALLGRLEQDRRVLASIARQLESRLDDERGTPWGRRTPRALLIEVLVAEPARLAQSLEAATARAEA